MPVINPKILSTPETRVFRKSNGLIRTLRYNLEMSTLKMYLDGKTVSKTHLNKQLSCYNKFKQIIKSTQWLWGTEDIIIQKGTLGNSKYHSQRLSLYECGFYHEATLFKYIDSNGNVKDVSKNHNLKQINDIQYLYNNRDKLTPTGKRIINEFTKHIPDIIKK